jgi:hypothetical protein
MFNSWQPSEGNMERWEEARRIAEAEEILKHFAAQESEFTQEDIAFLHSMNVSL